MGTSIAGRVWKKLAIFDQYLAYRVLSTVQPSGVVNRVPSDRDKLQGDTYLWSLC